MANPIENFICPYCGYRCDEGTTIVVHERSILQHYHPNCYVTMVDGEDDEGRVAYICRRVL